MHHEVERQVTAKVQLLKHILSITFLTLQAQPIQNNSAALLSSLSEVKILINSLKSEIIQPCTSDVLQHKIQ